MTDESRDQVAEQPVADGLEKIDWDAMLDPDSPGMDNVRFVDFEAHAEAHRELDVLARDIAAILELRAPMEVSKTVLELALAHRLYNEATRRKIGKTGAGWMPTLPGAGPGVVKTIRRRREHKP